MTFITRFANPRRFLNLSRLLMPIFGGAALMSFAGGLYYALAASPADYLQGETVRIMYIHVPAAWTSMAIYVAMALAAAFGIVSRHTLADIFCRAAATVGAVLTAICLITGSIWGKPTWGAWWVWDARLTSVLILFLLYCGYIVLRRSFDDDEQGAKAGAILLILGAINIPIIKFSVDWWNTLHQGASVLRLEKGGMTSRIDPVMLRPLLIMGFAYACYAGFMILLRMRAILALRRADALQRLGELD